MALHSEQLKLQNNFLTEFSDAVEKDVYDALKLESSIKAKTVYGGTALAQVSDQLKSIKEAFEW